MFGDFVKMTLTRVSSLWLWLESLVEKRDSSRVFAASFLKVTRVELSHQKSWVESNHWLKSHYHWFWPKLW